MRRESGITFAWLQNPLIIWMHNGCTISVGDSLHSPALQAGICCSPFYYRILPESICLGEIAGVILRDTEMEKGRKRSRWISAASQVRQNSDSTGDFPRTQATGAGVNPFRRAVHNRLDTHDIGLPGTVGPSVGVGNLNAESYAFSADIAFCHIFCTSLNDISKEIQQKYISRFPREKQVLFKKIGKGESFRPAAGKSCNLLHFPV